MATDEGRLRRNAAYLALPGRTTGCSGGEKRTSLMSFSPVAECHRQRRQCSTATAEPASPLLDGNDLERVHPRPRQRRSVLHVVTFLQLNRSRRCNILVVRRLRKRPARMRPNERLAQQNLSNFDMTPQHVSGHPTLVDDNHDTQNGPQLQKLLVSLHAAITHQDGHTHVSRTSMSHTT